MLHITLHMLFKKKVSKFEILMKIFLLRIYSALIMFLWTTVVTQALQ